MLDTGASATIVDLAVARAVGVDQATMTAERGIPTQGVAETKTTLWRHRFGELVIAGQRYRNPTLGIVDLGNTADMLIGQDFLRRRRVWLSFSSDTVYLSDPVGP